MYFVEILEMYTFEENPDDVSLDLGIENVGVGGSTLRESGC